MQNFFQRRDQEDDGERIARQARDQARHAEVVPLSLFSCLALLNDFQRRDQEEDGERISRLADQMARQARVRFVVVVINTGAMVVVFDDWQGHIFSGARSRR